MVLPLAVKKETLGPESTIEVTPPPLHHGVYLYVTTSVGEIAGSYASVKFTHDGQNRITKAEVTNSSSNTLYCYLITMTDV